MSVENKAVLPFPIPLFRSLFVITDPGRDLDDEDVIVALNRLIRIEILNVLGVVANLAPSLQRARLAKGTLKALGQPTIPVGIGSDCRQKDDDGLAYQFAVGYLAPTEEVEDGPELIFNTLSQAKPKSVVLLLISGLTDAAAVMKEHTHLFQQKVRRVVIMGGVTVKDDLAVLDKEGRYIPDLTAQNNAFDKEAAIYLHRQLQDLMIPTTIVTRFAANAAQVSRGMYDDLAATGHPVGIRLRDAQQKAIEELWRRAALPAEDPGRLGLPARCDKNWFCGQFLAGNGKERSATDSIWDIVQSFSLYDPLTLIAAIPDLRGHFFAPQVVEVHGVEHMLIGLSPKRHSVRNSAELAEFLQTTLVQSLMASLEEGARKSA